jgi:hypothetical protein
MAKQQTRRMDCPCCYGEGLDVDEPCEACSGTGTVSAKDWLALFMALDKEEHVEEGGDLKDESAVEERHWTGGVSQDADGGEVCWDGWQPGADPDTRERSKEFPSLFRVGERKKKPTSADPPER